LSNHDLLTSGSASRAACALDTQPGAGDVEPVVERLITDSEVNDRCLLGHPAAGDSECGIFGDEEDASKPVCFVLGILLP
jgi:hypothetical protein